MKYTIIFSWVVLLFGCKTSGSVISSEKPRVLQKLNLAVAANQATKHNVALTKTEVRIFRRNIENFDSWTYNNKERVKNEQSSWLYYFSKSIGNSPDDNFLTILRISGHYFLGGKEIR